MDFDPVPCVICKHRITVRTASFNTLYKRGNICVSCQSKQNGKRELASLSKKKKKRDYKGTLLYSVFDSRKGIHSLSKQRKAQEAETAANRRRMELRGSI